MSNLMFQGKTLIEVKKNVGQFRPGDILVTQPVETVSDGGDYAISDGCGGFAIVTLNHDRITGPGLYRIEKIIRDCERNFNATTAHKLNQ